MKLKYLVLACLISVTKSSSASPDESTCTVIYQNLNGMQQQQQQRIPGPDVPVAVGPPGKSGPVGRPGPPGEIGPSGLRGDKGEPAENVEENEQFLAMKQKLLDMEIKLNSSYDKIQEMQIKLNDEGLKKRQPSTCVTSSIDGRQMLSGGEEVYCDGGWTVFQKRFDGSVNFQRTWADYKKGFGDLSGEFWLGLDKIHNLTKDRGCRLRIDLWDFANDHKHALYSDFSVEDESDLYRVHVGGYSGTAGNSFSHAEYLVIDGKPFTTIDRDNDNSRDTNCAIHQGLPRGGFWYDACTMAYLNAGWGVPNIHWWLTWKGEENLAKTVMKFRCD